MATLTKGKRNVGAPNPQPEPIQLRSANEDPLYPPGFMPTHEPQMTYPSQSQLVRIYPYLYGPPPMVQTLGPMLFRPNPSVKLVNPIMVFDLNNLAEKEKLQQNDTREKYELLEERLRVVERINILGRIDASELSLVHGLMIPHKFKTPDFDKYNGTKCPSAHLTMYCRKMCTHTNNDKLLIYCFQDSLTGIAVQWYLKLNRTHIRTWKDLARTFFAQHKHAIDFTPNRLSL